MKKLILIAIGLLTLLLVLVMGIGIGWYQQNSTEGTDLVQLMQDAATGPTVKIETPSHGTTFASGSTVLVTVDVSSQAGVRQMEVLVDGEAAQSSLLGGQPTTARQAFSLMNLKPGWHRISAAATDPSGRRGVSDEVSVAVLALNSQQMADRIGGENTSLLARQTSTQTQGEEAQKDESGEQGASVPGQNPPNDEAAADRPVENPAGQGDEALPPIPPQPQDQPPVITAFNAEILLLGGQAEPTASANIIGAASDDQGLAELRLRFSGRNGGAVIAERAISQPCGGQLACQIESQMILSEGVWAFVLEALDTSGQVTSAVDAGVVLPAVGEPPAVVNPVADNPILDGILGQQGFDIAGGMEPLDPAQWLGRDWGLADGQQPSPEPACPPDDWVCVYGRGISVTINPAETGNQITLTVENEFAAIPGRVIIPTIQKGITGTGLVDRMYPPDWVAAQAPQLRAGQQFGWLDEDIMCGQQYSYTVGLNAYIPNEVENYLAGVGFPNSSQLAYETHIVVAANCGNNPLAGIELRSTYNDGMGKVTWQIPSWPGAPATGVGVLLARMNKTQAAAGNNVANIYEVIVPQADLIAGSQFSVADAGLECGNEYAYLMGLYDPANRPHTWPSGSSPWLAFAIAPAPQNLCPQGVLAQMPLHAQEGWYEGPAGNVPTVRLSFEIPAEVILPGGNGRISIFENARNMDGTAERREVVFFPLRVGQSNDFSHRYEQILKCEVASYQYQLVLQMNGKTINEGPILEWDPAPCPPKNPPALLGLRASNTCDGSPHCVIATWQPYDPSAIPPYYWEAVAIQIQRRTNYGNGTWTTFDVPLQGSQFMDHAAPCGSEITYRMVAIDARHRYTALWARSAPPMLSITTPACDQPWNVDVAQ